MRVARVKAQAKVNLFLRVHPGLDPQGYHHLFTAFQRIDLADDVVVRVGGGSRSLDVTGPRVPDGGLGPVEHNLAYRAAMAFLERRPMLGRGFAIELTKRIPVGGGLGGGSADAGAVLRALNSLTSEPLSANELHEVAASLGSDVPFLASEYVVAIGTRRGESLQPAPEPWMQPAAPMLVIVPTFGVATKDAYRWLDQDRPADTRTGPDSVSTVVPFRGWKTFEEIGNDFEAAVEKRHPVLTEYRKLLDESGALLSRMAGSGSSVFGIFDAPSWTTMDREALELELAAFGADVIETRTSSRVVEVEVLQ